MERTIFTLIALLGLGMAVAAQTTAYRQIASNTEGWDGAVWEEQDSARYFYAEAEQDTLFYSYNWDDINMEWRVSFRRYYTYDASGNITQYRTQLWDGTLFTDYEKEDRTYNAANQITSYTRYSWDGANWVGDIRFMYVYDAQGNNTSNIREDFVGGTWVNDDRTLYTYAGNLVQSWERQQWVAGAWEKETRNVYTRDANDNITIILGQIWDGSSYINDYQYVRNYDGNNNITLDTYVDWVSGAWDTVRRESFTYNTANKQTLLLKQNYTGSAWVNTVREIRTYANPELVDTFLRQSWNTGVWVNNIMQAYEYDGHDNQIYGISYTWDVGSWLRNYRYFSYFEAYQITGITEPFADLGATVYPNPFMENLHFKLPNEQSGLAEVKVFDLAGRIVLLENLMVMPGQQQFSISTGHLPTGGYVYALSLNGKQSRGLVMK